MRSSTAGSSTTVSRPPGRVGSSRPASTAGGASGVSRAPRGADGDPGVRAAVGAQALPSGRTSANPPPLPLREATPYPLRARISPGVFQALRPNRAPVTDGTGSSEIIRGLRKEVADALAPTGRSLPPLEDLHLLRPRAIAPISTLRGCNPAESVHKRDSKHCAQWPHNDSGPWRRMGVGNGFIE